MPYFTASKIISIDRGRIQRRSRGPEVHKTICIARACSTQREADLPARQRDGWGAPRNEIGAALELVERITTYQDGPDAA